MPLQDVTEDTMHTPLNDTPNNPHTTPFTHTPPTQDTPTPANTNNNGYAHLPLPTLRTTDIRLLSHNINTLHTTTQAELGATFDLYQEFDPTIIGIQECNKNWTVYDKTEGRLRDVTQRRWPGAKIVTSHSKDDAFKGPHQPGGVAQMVLCKLTGRGIAHGKDELGRYAWQEILLDGTHNLLVITAYRVTQGSITACGQETSVMQQWRKLRAKGIELPQPRQQVLDDLQAFAQPYETAGHEVIIMMDANAPIDAKAIEDFMEALNLHDLMEDYLPETPPKTYQRGRHKIDHVMGTIGVLTAMTGAGIIPFGEGPKSDHAILHADFALDTLCGMSSQSLHDPTHPSSRNLWSTDVKAAEKYIEIVRERFQEANIAERIAILIDRCNRTGQCSEADEGILNAIDTTITKVLLTAEVKCKQARGHDWSPLLATAGRAVIAAKWNLSDIRNGRISATLWNRAEAMIQAKAQVKEAYAVLRQVQLNATKIRESFLDDRAEHLASTRQIQKETALRQLIRAERQSSIFKRLGIWLKDTQHASLDRILTPDDPTDLNNTTWTTVVEAQALYEVLTKAGQEHFRQAANTPFVTGPIADKIGPFADNDYCEAILNGTFDLSTIEAITEVKDIITGMQYPDPKHPTEPINTTITTESFSDAMEHTRERTSSSPSGRHYGHYRALLRDKILLGLIAALANFCFQWGKTLKRWEKVTQPMIPKDPGTPRITRMRRITLIEADLNTCLSELFGRRLMINAEKHGILHKAQFGSRQGKMAISAVLLKRLSYDIIRQARMDACMLDNDATACYDRMIPSIAMLKSRRAGMRREAAQVVLTLLSRMEYFVRTAYGVSAEAFSNLIDWILGVMQGGGHSGCLWALTSSIMFEQMEETPGAVFHSPHPLRSSSRTGEAFVDDTSLWLLRLGMILTMAITVMQTSAQRWERLLYATGGALNLAKCFWYGIEWTFTPAGEPKMVKTTDGPQITLTSGNDTDNPKIIQRISTTKGQRTLGVRLAPDGNDFDEYTYRLEQSTKMKQRIKMAPLGREYIGIGFRAIWQMMIQYPLGATCFTKKQCGKIQAKYLPTFLSKMGINRMTATAVRNGPSDLGGMEVFQVETEQGVQHTKLMIAHLRKKDEIGRMLNISIDHLQLQAGVSWPVLSQPGHMTRKYVDQCYVSHTWEFLDSIKSHIRLEPDQWIRQQRVGDSFIMEYITHLPDIKPIELVHAQRCRLYLGVTTMADICTSNGQEICGWALNGDDNPRLPIYRFPRQAKPSPQVWTTWRTVLRRRYSTTRERKLDEPLGRWQKGRITQVWDTAIDPATSLIYMWINRTVRVYERKGRSQKQYRYLKPNTDHSFPRGCVPVSGDFQAGHFVISGYATMTNPTQTPPEQLTEMRLMNRGVHTTIPSTLIAQAIWDGDAIMGTDGSVNGDIATYSWVISMTSCDITADITGGGFLPPTAQYMAPYSKRPEAAALFAGLSWINDLLKQHPDTNPDNNAPPILPIPVDNEGVVKDVHRTINDQTPTFHLLNPDYDILQAIRLLIETLPIKTEIFHVKSHQDKHKPFEELTFDAQINVLADRQAAAIYSKPLHRTGLFPTWVPGTCAALFHGQHQVTKGIPDYIRIAKNAPEMKQYLIGRSQKATGRDSKWDDTIYESIAWQPLGESFKKLSIGQRIQMSKYMNDLLPTLRRLQMINNKMDGRCFDCGQLWEDTNHVLRCPSEDRCTARTETIKTFRQHLQKQHTPDIMATLICDSMTSWLHRRRITPPTWPQPEEPIMADLKRAFESQRKIGWDQFFRGRIAKDWKIAIKSYYRERQPGDSYTPDQWMRTTIAAIWKFSMTIWRQRNAALHGTDSAITLERRRKEAATKATTVYQDTIGNVLPSDSLILHRARINEILNWTKQHLDAYLATAEVICEQNVEPG